MNNSKTITLKTLSQATAQEVFDQIVNHLLTQNKQCENNESKCMYRSGNLKCAAGCLIADDEYNSDMEGHSWYSLVYNEIVPETHRDLINSLQDIHDIWKPDIWKSKLKEFAINYELEWNYN